ncbi:MAG: ATP-binding protein [Hyphomicrobium sp.]
MAKPPKFPDRASAAHQAAALPLLDRILDAARIGENDDWEFKSAKGGVPGSLWSTYSAFANTGGGTIVLGASEKGDAISLDGHPEAHLSKLKIDFESQINSTQKVSRNILANRDVQEVEVDGGWLLAIQVRPATRTERPIFVGQNPLVGTYKRRDQGDFKCTEEEVRRMFADASGTPADARTVQNFGLDDIDEASLNAYRNLLKASRPAGHPWVALGNKELLEQLGGWRTNRESGDGNITLAGLLMFGKHQSIINPEALPKFSVDYRDYRGRRPEERWGDRIFPDGTWEANLFQFYRRVWPKLTGDLKVPFALKGAQRIDETQAHEALREAIANAMMHADYNVAGGIVIKQYDDRFEIENPGTLLVSQEQLRRGNVSECRNTSVQRMFSMIGVGEQAGSGYARIQAGWKSQHWRAPRLTTQSEPDRVRLEMPMISLIPEAAFATLHQKLGPAFDRLDEQERLAMVTALLEGEVTNIRMQDLVSDHPAEITKLLKGLVVKGLLEHDNQRRWTRYKLPAVIAKRPDLFSERGSEADSSALGGDSTGLPVDSSDLTGDSIGLAKNSTDLPTDSPGLAAKGEEWKAAAARVSGKGKVPKQVMEEAILELCRGRFLTLAELAALLDRSAPNLRSTYLTPLTQSGRLRYRYPGAPNRPDQSYTAADEAP